MTEPRDVLDLLLRDAPPLPLGFEDGVLRRARRRRRVHRATVAAGTTGLTVAVAAGVVLANDRAPAPPARPAQTTTTPPPTTAPPAVPPVSVAREASIQSAAIRYLADDVGGGRRWPVLYVLDRRYRGIAGDPNRLTPAAPLSAASRAALTEALADYAPVEFVSDARDALDPRTSMGRHGGALVMLGVPVTARDGRVSMELSVQAGGRGGRGMALLLRPRSGGWSVTPTERGWIS